MKANDCPTRQHFFLCCAWPSCSNYSFLRNELFFIFKGLLPDNTGHLNFLHLLFFLQGTTFPCSQYGQCSLNLSQNNLDCTIICVIQLTTEKLHQRRWIQTRLDFLGDKQYLFLYPLPPIPTAIYIQQLMVELFYPISFFLNYSSAIVSVTSFPLSRNEAWQVFMSRQLFKQNTSVCSNVKKKMRCSSAEKTYRSGTS